MKEWGDPSALTAWSQGVHKIDSLDQELQTPDKSQQQIFSTLQVRWPVPTTQLHTQMQATPAQHVNEWVSLCQ